MNNSTLRSDPEKTRAWKDRSRRRIALHSPLSGGGCLKRSKIHTGKPKPSSVRDLERQLDSLVRKILRQDERVCFTDGCRGTPADPLEVSHLFGRSQRPTRFDVHPEGNNHLQHHSCNQKHNRDKSIYQNEFIRRFGVEAYNELDRRAHQSSVFEYTDLLRMIEQRKLMLR